MDEIRKVKESFDTLNEERALLERLKAQRNQLKERIARRVAKNEADAALCADLTSRLVESDYCARFEAHAQAVRALLVTQESVHPATEANDFPWNAHDPRLEPLSGEEASAAEVDQPANSDIGSASGIQFADTEFTPGGSPAPLAERDWTAPQPRIPKPCPIDAGAQYPPTFKRVTLVADSWQRRIMRVLPEARYVDVDVVEHRLAAAGLWAHGDLNACNTRSTLNNLCARGFVERTQDKQRFRRRSTRGYSQLSIRPKSDKMALVWGKILELPGAHPVFTPKEIVLDRDVISSATITQCLLHFWYDGYLVCCSTVGGTHRWRRRFDEKPASHLHGVPEVPEGETPKPLPFTLWVAGSEDEG